MWSWLLTGYRVSVWGYERVLKITVMADQHYECNLCH